MSIFYSASNDASPLTVHSWVRTGDEVLINEKKELFILDRMKVIISFAWVCAALTGPGIQEILKVKGFQGT